MEFGISRFCRVLAKDVKTAPFSPRGSNSVQRKFGDAFKGSSDFAEHIQQLEVCFQPEPEINRTCYVIVTARTLLWTLLTIASTLAMVAAVVTPMWLLGFERPAGLKTTNEEILQKKTSDGVFSPTVGIYNRCTKIHDFEQMFTDSCAPFVTSFNMPNDEFPHCWKAALLFFAFGLVFMVLTIGTSVIGCCKRSIRRKSIFTISGTIQSFAVLCYILALMLYPAGWGAERIKVVCGDLAGPYSIGDCSLGWAFYLSFGATILTFICSVLSVQAEISTSSDKVQDEILEGKRLICLW